MGGLENTETLGSEIIMNDDDNVVPQASEEFLYTSHVRTVTDKAMASKNDGTRQRNGVVSARDRDGFKIRY